jgi:hypothetical protein
VLRRVRGREAVLEKQEQTVVLTLPNARDQTAAPPQRDEGTRRGRR